VAPQNGPNQWTFGSRWACPSADAPGKPEITGYSRGQVLRTGDTARLVCVSRGGNPLAQVYWYRDDAELDFSYVSGGGRAENELVFRVEPRDNDAVYRCAASNQMTARPLTTDITLTVQCTMPLHARLVANSHRPDTTVRSSRVASGRCGGVN